MWSYLIVYTDNSNTFFYSIVDSEGNVKGNNYSID